MVARINASILTRHIRWVMERLKVEAPILWLYEPRHADLVGKFGEKLACYYNYDEMPDFAHNARIQALMRHYDNQLSSRADVVFVSSRGQAERRKQLNPYTTLVPNGVDFDHFHRALAPETHIPPDMANLKKPIVGFVGWMGYQLDIDLLIQIAQACPDYSFALIGPDNIPDDLRRPHLHGMRNVFFLGSKERELLPAYLKAIQVALIPYKLSGHTLTVYPLKLHEYLAAGRAIVATALPELAPFGQVVRIANTPEEYIQSIRAAMQEYTPQQIAARVAVARENTWDQRVEQIYRVFQAHPKLRGSNASRDDSLARPAVV
jgi:glycosyltransferase involved in cell wall biosynthesis